MKIVNGSFACFLSEGTRTMRRIRKWFGAACRWNDSTWKTPACIAHFFGSFSIPSPLPHIAYKSMQYTTNTEIQQRHDNKHDMQITSSVVFTVATDGSFKPPRLGWLQYSHIALKCIHTNYLPWFPAIVANDPVSSVLANWTNKKVTGLLCCYNYIAECALRLALIKFFGLVGLLS